MQLNIIHNEDCLLTMSKIETGTIDLIVTSPPYNFGGFNRDGRPREYDAYEDNLHEPEYRDFIKNVLTECARILKDGGSMYWNHKGKTENFIYKPTFWVVDICPLNFAQHIIWKFPSGADVAKIKWYPRKEDIYYFTKGKPKYFNEDMAQITDVWEINHTDMDNKHPAPYPLKLAERCIQASSLEDEIVYDPFMGSGTTAVACRKGKQKRNFIGSEISKQYIADAEKRIERYEAQTSLF